MPNPSYIPKPFTFYRERISNAISLIDNYYNIRDSNDCYKRFGAVYQADNNFRNFVQAMIDYLRNDILEIVDKYPLKFTVNSTDSESLSIQFTIGEALPIFKIEIFFKGRISLKFNNICDTSNAVAFQESAAGNFMYYLYEQGHYMPRKAVNLDQSDPLSVIRSFFNDKLYHLLNSTFKYLDIDKLIMLQFNKKEEKK